MISTEIRATTTRTTTMKAIVQDRYGTSEVLELREIAKPEIGEGDVLVRVRAAGVNPGDWAIMGGLPYIARPVYGLRKPKNRVRGTDVAGQVEAVGASVTRFRQGDEVFGSSKHLGGAFAEYAAVSEDALAPKPTNLTFEQAAAVPMAGYVALQALRDHGKVKAGQKVLVNGASGGIGTFAVQIAKSLGAEVTGVTSTRNSVTTSSSTTWRTTHRPTSDAHSLHRGCSCRTAGASTIGGSPVGVALSARRCRLRS